nr:hypothetical protein [Tanacetum cinerariifolium]
MVLKMRDKIGIDIPLISEDHDHSHPFFLKLLEIAFSWFKGIVEEEEKVYPVGRRSRCTCDGAGHKGEKTRDCGCSKGNVKDKILVPKPPKICARCTRCGYLVNGPNCQGCALLRQELKENLVTHSPDFQNTPELSNASTNVVNAPREPYVIKQDNGSLEAHIGYNCPSKVPVISNPEPCNNQTIDELPQTLPIFLLTFQSEAESPFTLDSTPTYVDESPNVFNPPTKSFVYPCEFFGTMLIMKLEEKQIEEERAAKAKYWKVPVCYDDDDDEERSDSLDDNIISGLPSFSATTPDEPVLFTEEPDNSLKIIPMKSLRTHGSSLPISSKIDSLLDEFADIRLIENVLYDNSSPRLLKEFVSTNSDAASESFSPYPILVEDSDSLMEKIDLLCTPNYPMPPGIVDKAYDSERDILILKDLPSNNTLSFTEKRVIPF